MQLIKHVDQAINQVSAPQELTLFVTGEQSRFVEAIKHEVIKKDSEDHLLEVLRLVMVKVGIRANNIPGEIETAVLLSHIATEYGNHTCEEIKLAFDLAIAAKLDLKEVSCYENFSCLYFSMIMNAYRLWAKEQAAQIKTKPVEKEEEILPTTEEEKTEWIDRLRNKENLSLQEIPIFIYDWLKLSNDAAYYLRSMSYCRVQIADENTSFAYKKTRLAEFDRQRDTEYFEGEFRTLIINTAKRMAVFHNLKPKPNG